MEVGDLGGLTNDESGAGDFRIAKRIRDSSTHAGTVAGEILEIIWLKLSLISYGVNCWIC
jgi:hypothetical protein